MSGHSKWSTIKHRKGAKDAKRSKVFTRLLKEIQVAAKEKGADQSGNPRLRLAVLTAKKSSIPKDTIERAISKGSGAGGNDFFELTYHAYAPHGVALIIECLTDNQNRVVANLRSYFSKYGGNLAVNGSVDYLFERKGVFILNDTGQDADELMLQLIEAGLDNADKDGGMITLTCPLAEYGTLSARLEELKIEVENSELQYVALTTAKTSVEEAHRVLKLINKIEDDDDVQNVFHNLEMSEELMRDLMTED